MMIDFPNIDKFLKTNIKLYNYQLEIFNLLFKISKKTQILNKKKII